MAASIPTGGNGLDIPDEDSDYSRMLARAAAEYSNTRNSAAFMTETSNDSTFECRSGIEGHGDQGVAPNAGPDGSERASIASDQRSDYPYNPPYPMPRVPDPVYDRPPLGVQPIATHSHEERQDGSTTHIEMHTGEAISAMTALVPHPRGFTSHGMRADERARAEEEERVRALWYNRLGAWMNRHLSVVLILGCCVVVCVILAIIVNVDDLNHD